MAPIPGLNELVILLFVALMVFGTSKLPAIATSLGKALWRLRHRASGSAQAAPEAPSSSEGQVEDDEDDEDEDEPGSDGPNE
jgi:TatA/E family protein of Tat protein translocase